VRVDTIGVHQQTHKHLSRLLTQRMHHNKPILNNKGRLKLLLPSDGGGMRDSLQIACQDGSTELERLIVTPESETNHRVTANLVCSFCLGNRGGDLLLGMQHHTNHLLDWPKPSTLWKSEQQLD